MKRFLKALGMGTFYFAVFMGIQFLISMGGTLLLLGNLVYEHGMDLFGNVESFHQMLMETLLRHMTGMVLISNLVTIGGFWLSFRLRHQNLAQKIGLIRTSGRNLSLSVIFGAGVCFFMDLMTGLLPVPEPVMDQFEMQHGMLWFGDAGLTFLSVAIVGPVSEEICFRGLCYESLQKGMKPWAACILSSVFFGMAHGDPVWFLVGFTAGLFLSWIQKTTGSLWCAIAVHVTNNAISSMMAYVPVSGNLHRMLIFGSVPVMVLSGLLLVSFNSHRRGKEAAVCRENQ